MGDCFATGWGKDKFGSDGEYQVILKQVQMDIEDHDQCENEFQQSRLGKNFQLDDSFLCAGGQQGKDTCKGDGGGPLVCPSKSNPGRYEQVGIVAWGLDVEKKHQEFTLMSLKPCVSLTGQPNVSMELTEITTALGSETDGLNMNIVNTRRKLMIMRKMLKMKKERSPTLAHPQKEKQSGKISEVITKISKR